MEPGGSVVLVECFRRRRHHVTGPKNWAGQIHSAGLDTPREMPVGLGVLVAGGHSHFLFQSARLDLTPFAIRCLTSEADAIILISHARKLRL